LIQQKYKGKKDKGSIVISEMMIEPPEKPKSNQIAINPGRNSPSKTPK
jgi:hypothetical protein